MPLGPYVITYIHLDNQIFAWRKGLGLWGGELVGDVCGVCRRKAILPFRLSFLKREKNALLRNGVRTWMMTVRSNRTSLVMVVIIEGDNGNGRMVTLRCFLVETVIISPQWSPNNNYNIANSGSPRSIEALVFNLLHLFKEKKEDGYKAVLIP